MSAPSARTGGGKGGPLIDQGGSRERLASVIEVITLIQMIATMERNRVSTPIPPGFFGVREQTDTWGVAAKKVLYSSIFTMLLTPPVIMVFEKDFPIFGEPPTAAGKLLTLVLGFGFTFVQATFFGLVGKCYVGEYTKKMVYWFMLGIATGALGKALLGLVGYNLLALYWMSPARLGGLALFCGRFLSEEKVILIYEHLLEFRWCLVDASWLVVASSLIITLWPLQAILRQRRINRLTEEIFSKRRRSGN